MGVRLTHSEIKDALDTKVIMIKHNDRRMIFNTFKRLIITITIFHLSRLTRNETASISNAARLLC